MDDRETREELNRLYWESDESVAEIADRLDISRRALYDGIEPRPAGAPCPQCGAALGFRNRTAAESREAECESCGREVTLESDPSGGGGRAESPPRAKPKRPPQVEQEREAAPLSPTRHVPASSVSGSGPVLGILLLAGIGLGAAILYAIRRG